MTLQQMRYLLAIAQYGSISAAAQSFFVSQSTLSSALKEVEAETGVVVFNRTSRGVEATLEGHELLSMVRQIVEQDDLLNSRFGKNGDSVGKARFSVSGQHYSLGVDAFIDLVNANPQLSYSFTYRETRTQEVIDDVKTFRSHIGLLYLSSFNKRILQRDFDCADLEFTPLFEAKPQVLVAEGHPLAERSIVKPSDLVDYPCIKFEKGSDDSLYYAEEPLLDIPCRSTIVVRDRSTLISVLAKSDGYTIATGTHSTGMDYGIASVPLRTDETMLIGYILHAKRAISPLTVQYIQNLGGQVIARHKAGQIIPVVREESRSRTRLNCGAIARAELFAHGFCPQTGRRERAVVRNPHLFGNREGAPSRSF